MENLSEEEDVTYCTKCKKNYLYNIGALESVEKSIMDYVILVQGILSVKSMFYYSQK